MMFEEKGYEFIHNFLSDLDLNPVEKELSRVSMLPKRGGIRNAEKRFSSVKALVNSPKLLTLVKHYLEGCPRVVRVILFHKSLDSNWRVSWHQDKTVSLTNKMSLEGWGPWSKKDDILHVQPPLSVLEHMVSVRLHLDNATKSNGCLTLLPESHKQGVMSQNEIEAYVKQAKDEIDCELKKGDLLVMKPHILHASSKAESADRRRVLHIEYSDYELPEGVAWA